MPLLAALLAAQLLASAPLARAGEAPTPASASAQKATPPPAYIELDGRRVLEIRVAVGAQTPAQLAGRSSRRLKELAATYSIKPEQIVLQEDPPYTTIGVMRGGKFEPGLSVDDRNAARFQLSRQQLAQRYLEQIRAAIVRYRQTHRRSHWLRGGALALLALGFYILWLRGQIALYRCLELWINDPTNGRIQGLQVGGNEWITADQVRSVLDPLQWIVHGAVLLLVSYLSIPLFLGLFPPTQALSETLRGQSPAWWWAVARPLPRPSPTWSPWW